MKKFILAAACLLALGANISAQNPVKKECSKSDAKSCDKKDAKDKQQDCCKKQKK